MVKLTCLDSVSQWKHEQVSRYPEISLFIDKLKNMIREKPQHGLPDPFLSETGKTIPCLKYSVYISLFSCRYALGYSFVTASYVYNNTDALIIKMTFS